MQVVLEAIKFNHDPNSVCCDALSIRRNATEFVAVPEWRRGVTNEPDQSPAAYSIKETFGNKITIQAKFRRVDHSIGPIEVQAIDPFNPTGESAQNVNVGGTNHSNILGRVKARPVNFTDGDDTEFESFTLENTRIQDVGVSTGITVWEWQYRIPPDNSWKAFENTRHRIYVVVRKATLPWKPEDADEKNAHLVWAEVLDHACSWGAGTRELDDAAAAITRGLRDVEKQICIIYDPDSAYSFGDFDCTGFLKLLRDELGAGAKLNCTDCATIVSTFANALGCELSQSAMSSRLGFVTNPVRLIGRTCFHSTSFLGHELAWENECTENDEVFDACIELDGDEEPTAFPHKPLLATNMTFGTSKSMTDEKHYFAHMVAPARSQPLGLPFAVPSSKQRRPVRPSPKDPVKRLHGKIWRSLDLHYGYKSWRKAFSSTERLFVTDIRFKRSDFPSWRFLDDPQRIEKPNRGPFVQVLVEIFEGFITKIARVDLEICSSERAARHFLLERLGAIETTEVKRIPNPGFGDVSFFEPQGGSLVFSRGNTVVSVRNATSRTSDLVQAARRLDGIIKMRPEYKDEEQKQWFTIPDGPFLIGSLVLLIPHHENNNPMTFKFFSSLGSIKHVNDSVFYSSCAAGHETLTVCGIDAQARTSCQRLEFDVL